VTYAERLMNICMAIGVRPTGGGGHEVTLVGTDGTNEIRFEPVLRGRFLRVNFAAIDPAVNPADTLAITDLNPHLRNCNKITCSICITAGRSCSSNLRGTYLDAA